MLKDIFKIQFFFSAIFVLILLTSCKTEERFEIVNIPCESRVSIPTSLDTILLTSDLAIFAPVSVVSVGDSININQLRLVRSDDYEIAFGYCSGIDLLNISGHCADYKLFVDGEAEIELPLVFNTNPLLAHPLFNTPFVMKICQDGDTLGALIWEDPSGSAEGIIQFSIFLNLERSNTIFRVGSGWAKDDSGFQQVRNIINTISKKI